MVPQTKVTEVLRLVHNVRTSGHLEMSRTVARLRQAPVYWRRMKGQAEEWCRKCHECGSKKSPPRPLRAPLQQYIVGAPMKLTSLADFQGPEQEIPASLWSQTTSPSGSRLSRSQTRPLKHWPESSWSSSSRSLAPLGKSIRTQNVSLRLRCSRILASCLEYTRPAPYYFTPSRMEGGKVESYGEKDAEPFLWRKNKKTGMSTCRT